MFLPQNDAVYSLNTLLPTTFVLTSFSSRSPLDYLSYKQHLCSTDAAPMQRLCGDSTAGTSDDGTIEPSDKPLRSL